MKKLAYGIVGLVVLVIVAAIALPFLIPAEKLKEELVFAANDATGRILSIDGDFGVSVFPVLGLNATKVSFSNAPNSNIPNMASIDKLTIELNLMPLLSGQVSVDKFILEKPVIVLEVDKAGNKNWEFASVDAKDDASAAKVDDDDNDAPDLGIRDLNLGDVQIIGGSITYSDATGDVHHEITDANLSLDLRGLDEVFRTTGSAVWKGEKIELNTELGALRAVLENKATSVKASVKSSKVNLTFSGDLKSTAPLTLNGSTELDVPSLKGLLAWAATPLDAADGTFEKVLIKGDVGVNGSKYSFTNADFGFDAIQANGDFSVDLGGKVPSLKGRLDLPVLDTNPYISNNGSASKTAEATPAAANGEKWDSTPFDFSGLKAANAEFKLNLGQLLIEKVKIDKTTLMAVLKDGVLTLDLEELALYDGRGKGKVVLDARSAQAKISKEFSLEGLQLKPLLTDAADFERLEGTGMIQLAITTSGTSQKTMVDNLNGDGKILFADGAITGVNLAAMARNVTSAFTGGGEVQKTDFAELSGTYTIVNGLLTNTDLKLLNPFIQVTGKGTVSMPPKTLDYRLEPKVTASTEGQGSGASGGITVPIKISGSWDDPSYAPDLAGALSNIADPKALKETLEKSGKEQLDNVLKGGDSKGALGGLTDGVKGSLGGLFGTKKN
ncbi:MAG: AsmA family protein [Sneathiella sp.]